MGRNYYKYGRAYGAWLTLPRTVGPLGPLQNNKSANKWKNTSLDLVSFRGHEYSPRRWLQWRQQCWRHTFKKVHCRSSRDIRIGIWRDLVPDHFLISSFTTWSPRPGRNQRQATNAFTDRRSIIEYQPTLVASWYFGVYSQLAWDTTTILDADDGLGRTSASEFVSHIKVHVATVLASWRIDVYSQLAWDATARLDANDWATRLDATGACTWHECFSSIIIASRVFCFQLAWNAAIIFDANDGNYAKMSARFCALPTKSRIRIKDAYVPSYDPDTSIGIREWCQHIDHSIETYNLEDFEIRMKVCSL